MRVTPEERVYLQLLEGALQVSEYTDKLDITRGCLVVDLFCLTSFASSLLPHLFCLIVGLFFAAGLRVHGQG